MSDRMRPRRTSSLKLTTRPTTVPIPPSLLASPYLTSPESIFQREIATPYLPSEADERWLQDTVPLDAAEPVTGTISGWEENRQFLRRRRSSPHLNSRDWESEHDDRWDRSSQSQLTSPELSPSVPPSAAARPRLTGAVPTGSVMSPPSISVIAGTISRRQSTNMTIMERSSQRATDSTVTNSPDKSPRPFVVHSDVTEFECPR